MSEHQGTTTVRSCGINHSSSAPPVAMPVGHVGEFVIPGTGRHVWWTGRVAIGLLHQPERYFEPVAQSSLWIQDLMLGSSRRTGIGKIPLREVLNALAPWKHQPGRLAASDRSTAVH
jgi:hypothetical protein